jgi:uncharacterized membrane protein
MREIGLIMIFLGIFLFFIAAILPMLAEGAEVSRVNQTSSIFCIFILFFPICFGYGKASSQLILASIILAIVLMVFSYLIFRTISKQISEEQRSMPNEFQ